MRFLAAFVGSMRHLVSSELQKLPLLTYEEAMKYFVTHIPQKDKKMRGILLREKTPQGILITQIFMDDKENIISEQGNKDIPYGRRMLVDALDEELMEHFGNVDMIVAE